MQMVGPTQLCAIRLLQKYESDRFFPDSCVVEGREGRHDVWSTSRMTFSFVFSRFLEIYDCS